jgi:hypothetical protein
LARVDARWPGDDEAGLVGDHDQWRTIAGTPCRHGSVDVRLAVVGLITSWRRSEPEHPISRSNAHQHSVHDAEPNDGYLKRSR